MTEIDTASRLTGPLTYSGSLDSYEQFDVTPVVGREFPTLQASDLLDDDVKLRDLAILGLSTPERQGSLSSRLPSG